MNKNLLILIGAIAIFAIIFITDITLKNGPLTGNAVNVSIISVKESSDIYTVNAEYPQFNGMAILNTKISDLVESHIKDFKKNANDTWKAMSETASEEYPLPTKSSDMFFDQVTWEPVQINKEYVSIVLNISYFSGGAHGSDEIYTFNYDVKNKEIITSQQLLSQEGLDKLALMAKDYIVAEMGNRGIEVDESLNSMINEGTTPTYENYKDFTFNKNMINFYFQKYQVAPGVAGSFIFPAQKLFLKNSGIETKY